MKTCFDEHALPPKAILFHPRGNEVTEYVEELNTIRVRKKKKCFEKIDDPSGWLGNLASAVLRSAAASSNGVNSTNNALQHWSHVLLILLVSLHALYLSKPGEAKYWFETK
jgi:hypothetical protein